MKSLKLAYLAIDPGINGAAAWMTPTGQTGTAPFSSPAEFLATLSLFKAKCVGADGLMSSRDFVCLVEQVGGYTGKAQPASSAFKFGQNFGFIIGSLMALQIPFLTVAPTRWQKHYPVPTKSSVNYSKHKRELRDIAAKLFPNEKVTLKNADAFLLLHYSFTYLA